MSNGCATRPMSAKQIRLTPEQYRRLWASIRAEFQLSAEGKPIRIDHPGYGFGDAFYHGIGKANAISTCNQWAAGPPSRRRSRGAALVAVRPGAGVAVSGSPIRERNG